MSDEFPEDENGKVLRRLRLGGDNLEVARDVNFSVIFPNKISAERFARLLEELGYPAGVEHVEYGSEYVWDVTIRNNMVPTHSDISNFEAKLEALAEPLGGENDGWGCFRLPS